MNFQATLVNHEHILNYFLNIQLFLNFADMALFTAFT